MRNRILIQEFLRFPKTLFDTAGVPERKLIPPPETALVRMEVAVRKQRRPIRSAQSSVKIMNRQTYSVPHFNSPEKAFRSGNLLRSFLQP